jgi:hypothetical protein
MQAGQRQLRGGCQKNTTTAVLGGVSRWGGGGGALVETRREDSTGNDRSSSAAARTNQTMVAPGFLDNPEVRRWLGGIEPAWTLLDFESLNALRREPSRDNRALSLANDLTADEIATSAVTRNTLILLRQAADGDGLKLTATGNLSRTVVAELASQFDWPGLDPAEVYRLQKVVNEPDFLPLFFVRQVAQFAKLVRPHKGRLRATPLGRDLLTEEKRRVLQPILFHLTFWHADLGYFGRGMHGSWPKGDIGILLWSLSVAAADWQTPEKLTRLCTIPVNGVLTTSWDSGSVITEARILRPLVWFGLLDHRVETAPGARFTDRHAYRKTPLFDRFLKFSVRTEQPITARH